MIINRRRIGIHIRRRYRGETRLGIYQNVTSAIDRACVGGWYVAIHALLVRVDLFQMGGR